MRPACRLADIEGDNAAGHHWRKLAPVPILALVTEYQNQVDEQVVVLFQILAAEINFGYKFQTVQCLTFNGTELPNLRALAQQVDSCTCALPQPPHRTH